METEHRFYVSISPGMENMAYLELCQRLAEPPFLRPAPVVEFHKGGLEVTLPTTVGLALNSYLRLSSRILMRVANFDSPKIYAFKKQMALLPWRSFFKDKVQLQFTSRSSKLSVKKQILRELEPLLKKQGLQWGNEGPSLFVRLFRDSCEVSIDTTGARGQFRGQGKVVGQASLRDTTAAGLLRMLMQGLGDEERITLVDPMAGGGTFLMEALERHCPLDRGFVCESFPVYDASLRPQKMAEYSPHLHVMGIERDSKTAAKGRKNLSRFPSEVWTWIESDYKGVEARPEAPVMIMNPPWGKRIPQDRDPQWLDKLLKNWKPRRLGLLWHGGALPSHAGYSSVRHLWLENSGLRNQFIVLIPKAHL